MKILKNDTIEGTKNHLVYVDGKGFVEMRDVKNGDRVLTHKKGEITSSYVTVTGVNHDQDC